MSAIYVYPDLQVNFIHLPKCAGTSFRTVLHHISDNVEQYHAHIPNEYQDFWTFTITRNPFDRFISAWKYCIKKGWVDDCSSLTFLNLVKQYEESGVCVTHEEHHKFKRSSRYSVLHHSAPMAHPSRLTDRAEYVGKMEELGKVIGDFEKWYDVELPFPHLNKTHHDDYPYYYDSALYAQVRDYYKEDFEVFNYLTILRQPSRVYTK